jgi:hypothetical protein
MSPIYVPGKVTLRQTWQPMDPDAAAYITAVETADGQALEEKVKIAIDNFVLGCKADGIWSAIKASCILAGARTTNGALVPLVGPAPDPYNFDLIGDTDYDRKTGLAGDGSTKYLDSKYAIPIQGQNNAHAACRVSQIAGDAQFLMADGVSGGRTNISASFSSSQIYSRITSSNQTTISEVPGTGVYGVSRSSSSSYVLRTNGTNKNISDASAPPPGNNMGIFTTTISQNFYFNGRVAFYSIGESLDLALLDARVTDLINAIGVAIP